MKKFFIFMLCFLICISGAVGTAMLTCDNCSFAEAEAVNKITMMGTGEIRLVPDVAVVSIGVETLNDSLSVAQKENADNINNLINVLKDMGVAEENIKTKNFYVYQRYDYTQGEAFMGYQVSNYLDFRTKDVDGVGNIISKLLESGANRFSGISFTIENYEEAYKTALEKALDNAKSKASAITNAEIKASEIVEESGYSVMTRDSYMLSSAQQQNSTFMKGEICIKATIKAVFEY